MSKEQEEAFEALFTRLLRERAEDTQDATSGCSFIDGLWNSVDAMLSGLDVDGRQELTSLLWKLDTRQIVKPASQSNSRKNMLLMTLLVREKVRLKNVSLSDMLCESFAAGARGTVLEILDCYARGRGFVFFYAHQLQDLYMDPRVGGREAFDMSSFMARRDCGHDPLGPDPESVFWALLKESKDDETHQNKIRDFLKGGSGVDDPEDKACMPVFCAENPERILKKHCSPAFMMELLKISSSLRECCLAGELLYVLSDLDLYKQLFPLYIPEAWWIALKDPMTCLNVSLRLLADLEDASELLVRLLDLRGGNKDLNFEFWGRVAEAFGTSNPAVENCAASLSGYMGVSAFRREALKREHPDAYVSLLRLEWEREVSRRSSERLKKGVKRLRREMSKTLSDDDE